MNTPILFTNNSYFISIVSTLLDMTINNPIFIFAIITVIWFIPGLIVRKISENKQKSKKKKSQDEALKRLYPKE